MHPVPQGGFSATILKRRHQLRSTKELAEATSTIGLLGLKNRQKLILAKPRKSNVGQKLEWLPG